VHAFGGINPDAGHVADGLVMLNHGTHLLVEAVDLGVASFIHHTLNAPLILF
jgi:hypothetical protein